VDDDAQGTQHLVAAQVPGAVVDGLQPVEVDHEHAEATVAATGAAHLLLEGQEQLRAVEEAGQRISARQVDHALHGSPLVTGVGDGHEGEEPGRDDADRQAQRVLRPVLAQARIHEQRGGEGRGGQDGRGEPRSRPGCERGSNADEGEQHRERRRGVPGQGQQAADEGRGRHELGEPHQPAARAGADKLVEDHDGEHRRPAQQEDRRLFGGERAADADAEQDDRDRQPPHHAQRGIGPVALLLGRGFPRREGGEGSAG
jgi:hypothetical protein